jgi:hypothetical protein
MPKSNLATSNQFSASPTSTGTPPSAQSASKPISNQQAFSSSTFKTSFPHPPAIRTPIMPLTSTFQTEMPQFEPTPNHYKFTTSAAELSETESYEEVYRKAKETADNLKKMLSKK